MNIDNNEIKKFDDIAYSWWDPSGPFKPLHMLNPVRTNFIKTRVNLEEKSITLAKVLKEAKMVPSTSEALRLIKQGAVRIEGEKILDSKHEINLNSSLLYQVGKRNFSKIKIAKK